jgi:cell division protease FtsH
MDEFGEDALRNEARLLRQLLDRYLGALPEEEEDGEQLIARLESHLGARPSALPVVTATWAAHEQADVQLALERWLEDRQLPSEVLGTPHQARRHSTLAELLAMARYDRGFTVGPPDWVHVPVSPDDTHPCVAFGLYLVGGRTPFALLLRGPDPQTGHDGVQLEVLASDPEAAGELVAELRRLAVELSPVRGQIVTLAPPDRPGGSPIAFLRRPQLPRDRLVLPEPTLEAVERQVIEVAALRDRLRASGQHLKRGLLLYGPPGTGKTHTVRYLLGRLDGTTAVVLSGSALGLVSAACTLARRHQPSVVVLEDVDLVASDRSFAAPGSNALLFEILNELDGLGDDVDVVFVLTTNRVDVLERALAERPGRVDEAVEVGPPDAAGRERLLRLYGADAGLAGLDLRDAVAATEGVTATYLRELVRRAVVQAALARPGDPRVAVRQEDLDAAAADLASSRAALTRALLGVDPEPARPRDLPPDSQPGWMPGPSPGYSSHGWFAYGPMVRRGRRSAEAPVEEATPPPAPPGWEDSP